MNKHKHLQESERVLIETHLNNRLSFKAIGRELGKDPTTISKEIKNHIQYKKTGCYGAAFNDFLYCKRCTVTNICKQISCKRKLCNYCKKVQCSKVCPDYHKQSCEKLIGAPYVCNSCEERNSCRLEKRIYKASYAQNEYENVLTESRHGIQISKGRGQTP